MTKPDNGLSRQLSSVSLGMALAATLSLAGCNTLTGNGSPSSLVPPLPFQASETETAETDAVADDDSGVIETVPGAGRLVGFVTGKKYENLSKGKQLYQRGDTLFKRASNAPKDEREAMFAEAAGLFKKSGKEAPGSGLEQDALFMQGEALFFANDLNGARDVMETLQKNFPRNRHSDRAAARLFSISKYWIEVAKAGGDQWYNVNLFDDKRPTRDAVGHAIRVLDQIRYDDPTGKLADDATMAAAAEHIRNEQYEMADEFLMDLRETFTDSDHQFLAHLLGIRCKLEIYRGPRYSERVLEEADELVQQTRRRFPTELKKQKYNEMLARAAAEIEYHKAQKLAFRAEYRAKQREYGASRELYRQLLRDHPTTPQAKQATAVLAKIDELPSSPQRSLAFLTKVFPSAKRSTPLITVESEQPTSEAPEAPSETTGKKLLR